MERIGTGRYLGQGILEPLAAPFRPGLTPVGGALRLRGATRWLQAAFFLACGAGAAIAAAWWLLNPEPGDAWWYTLAPAAVALVFLGFGVRAPRRGIDAGNEGIVITNLFTTRRVPWPEVLDVGAEPVVNGGGGTVYYRLVVETPRAVLTAETPGGDASPGGYIDRARSALLELRDAHVRSASTDAGG